MKKLRKLGTFFISTALVIGLLPNMAFTKATNDFEVGNSDINIQNGGIMLSTEDDLYFVEDGIFVERGESVTPICADDAENLNLYNGFLYYTLGCGVYTIPQNGGETQLIFTSQREIEQMYVVNGDLIYLAGGEAFILENGAQQPQRISGLSHIAGIIPTQYGNILLTGKPQNRTVWVDENKVISDVTSCYTDSGYLAVLKNGNNYMVELHNLFDGFVEQTDLLDYNIHGHIAFDDILDETYRTEIYEDRENTELMCNFDKMLSDAGMNNENANLMSVSDEPIIPDPDQPVEPVIPEVSQGQKNIVLRARQLHEIEWKPLVDRTQWGYQGVFKAGRTYKGLPYSQAVNTNGYVGYGVSLEKFATDMNDNRSKFYTTYSNYGRVAPAYGTDCSGFVSYAWNLPLRRTTYSIPGYAERVGDQSIYSLQIGDVLDKTTNHIVLVSDVTYDSEGKVTGVEIMEETPVITRLSRYGEGQSRSLFSLQSYYLQKGYEIYRNPNRDSVSYIPSPYVPLDNEVDTIEKAPTPSVGESYGVKTVSLSSENPNATIYYTLDGSAPSESSMRYTTPIKFTNESKLRAIAVSSNYGRSMELKYTVSFPKAEMPSYVISSGVKKGEYVSKGSRITINSSNGVEIHYTTDGSEPTMESPVYTQPIVINENTTIKAFSVANGMTQSKISTINLKVGNVYTISVSVGQNGNASPNGNIQVIQSDDKTIKFTPLNGYKVKDVVVDGNSVGAVSQYTFRDINSNHTISASFAINSYIPFTDVRNGQWFYDSVCYAYSNNLFNGTSKTTFSPDVTMNRGMFVTVLGRIAGVSNNLNSGIGVVTGEGVNIRKGPSTDTQVVGFVSNRYTAVQVIGVSANWYKIQYGSVIGYIRNDLITAYNGVFHDLPSNQYYSQFVEWAYLMGITKGTGNGTFNAEQGISREGMCVMLYNYAKKYGKALPNNSNGRVFSDDSSISPSAKTAVYALRRAGIIEGTGNNTLNPKGTASRAHVSQIFMNFIKAVD